MKRTAEHQARLTAALKAKWASGTRRNGNSEAVKKKISAALKKAYAEGRKSPPEMTAEKAKRMRSCASPSAVAAACRRTARKKVGKPNPPGPSARGVQHFLAKRWVLRDPDRRVHEFTNLSEFLRTHQHLFDPADLNWKGPSCRAAKRISQLASPSGNKEDWKGWVVLDKCSGRGA